MWTWLSLLATLIYVIAAPEIGVWLAGPKGHYYLIGKGKESWINAREYCLARNADLMSLESTTSYGWLLQHFMPSPRNPGHIQIGLFRSFFPEWRWISTEMFREKIDVLEEEDQCGVLSLKNGSYSSVACDYEPVETTRFVCERTAMAHEEQHKTDNGLWSKWEALLEYLGLRRTTTTEASTTAAPVDLEDPGELAKDIEHAEKLLAQEGSGQEDMRPASVAAADRLLPLVERGAEEGSGAEIEGALTEGSGEQPVGKEPVRAAEIEEDFNVDDTINTIEDVPIPLKKDDCMQSGKAGDEAVELLAMLRKFLSRAAHPDLRRLVDDDSHSLKERLLRGISEANAREFEAVLPAEEQLQDTEKELLFDELSKLLVSEETTRQEALRRKEDFL